MGRPKKQKKEFNHGDRYEIKQNIKDAFGNIIMPRHSFYSKISKEDAIKQAEEYQTKLLISSATGEPTSGNIVTFKSWAETWLETYKKGKVKDSTYYATYRNIVDKHLIPYFGSYNIAMIKPIDIQKFFDKKAKKNALETIKKMRTYLNAIFNTAIENGYCAKNPVTKNIKIFSEKAPCKKNVYLEDQYNKLEEFAKKNSSLDIMLLLKTGISRSELLGLKWENIDYDNAIIWIMQGTTNVKSIKTEKMSTVSDGLKTEYRRRPIPIDPELLQMLKDKPQIISVGGNKKKKRPPKKVKTEYVIYNSKGGIYNPDNWCRNVYKPFMQAFHEETGIPALNTHELRHTCATHWKDMGVDIFSIAKLGGWSDLEMLSKRYGHNNIESLKKALKL